MTNKTINDFTEISTLSLTDEFLVYDSSASTTNKVRVETIVDLVSVAAQNPVDASNVAAAGATMESYFGGQTGYVIRNGSASYSGVSTIPVSVITGLGALATKDSVSVVDISGLGVLATLDGVSVGQVSGLASVATTGDYNDLINTPSIPSVLNDLSNVDTSGSANGKVLTYQLGTWVPASVSVPTPVSVDASAISAAGGILDSQFTGLGYVKKTGTQEFTEVCTIPADDVAGLGTLATTSTAASGISFLGLGTLATRNDVSTGLVTGLGQLATVNASVSNAATNQYLQYNGTQWVPASVSGGGGGSTTLSALTDVSVSGVTNNQVLTYNTSAGLWVASSVSGGGGTSLNWYAESNQIPVSALEGPSVGVSSYGSIAIGSRYEESSPTLPVSSVNAISTSIGSSRVSVLISAHHSFVGALAQLDSNVTVGGNIFLTGTLYTVVSIADANHIVIDVGVSAAATSVNAGIVTGLCQAFIQNNIGSLVDTSSHGSLALAGAYVKGDNNVGIYTGNSTTPAPGGVYGNNNIIIGAGFTDDTTYNNLILNTADTNNVGNITTSSYKCVIIASDNADIVNESQQTIIINSNNSHVSSSSNVLILNSRDVNVSSGGNDSIIGGAGQSIKDSFGYNVLLGGNGSQLVSSDDSVIIGYGQVSGVANVVAMAGAGIGVANTPAFFYAVGLPIYNFDNGGSYVITQQGQTTDATPLVLGTTFPNSDLTILSGNVYTFKIMVAAHDTVGHVAAGYELTGVIKNNGSATFVGTPSKVAYEDTSAASWDCTVSADSANSKLSIIVTGASATTIDWTATVQLTHAH